MKATKKKLTPTQQNFATKYGEVVAYCLALAGIDGPKEAQEYLTHYSLDTRLVYSETMTATA